MTEKRFTTNGYKIYDTFHDGVVIIDHLKKDLIYIDGEEDLELAEYIDKLQKENEQLKQQLNRLYNYFEDWYSDMTSANDFSEIRWAVRDGDITLWKEEVIHLLNELSDENEQLKQSQKEFEDECQSTFNAMNRTQNVLYHKNFKLKEEIGQLKQHNIELINKIDFLERVVDGDV